MNIVTFTKTIFILFLLFTVNSLFGDIRSVDYSVADIQFIPYRTGAPDSRAVDIPESELKRIFAVGGETSIGLLTQYLTSDTNDEALQVKRIHDWIALNIYYYKEALLGLVKIDRTPSNVINTRRTTCSGYSKLFMAMSRLVGIEVKYIYGEVAGSWYGDGKVGDHAWNSVKINGIWSMVDVTFDSSLGFYKGKYKSGRYNDQYLFFKPELRLLSCYPNDDADLFCKTSMSRDDFFKQRLRMIWQYTLGCDVKPADSLIETYQRINDTDSSHYKQYNLYAMNPASKSDGFDFIVRYHGEDPIILTPRLYDMDDNRQTQFYSYCDYTKKGEVRCRFFPPSSGLWRFSILGGENTSETVIHTLYRGYIKSDKSYSPPGDIPFTGFPALYLDVKQSGIISYEDITTGHSFYRLSVDAPQPYRFGMHLRDFNWKGIEKKITYGSRINGRDFYLSAASKQLQRLDIYCRDLTTGRLYTIGGKYFHPEIGTKDVLPPSDKLQLYSTFFERVPEGVQYHKKLSKSGVEYEIQFPYSGDLQLTASAKDKNGKNRLLQYQIREEKGIQYLSYSPVKDSWLYCKLHFRDSDGKYYSGGRLIIPSEVGPLYPDGAGYTPLLTAKEKLLDSVEFIPGKNGLPDQLTVFPVSGADSRLYLVDSHEERYANQVIRDITPESQIYSFTMPDDNAYRVKVYGINSSGKWHLQGFINPVSRRSSMSSIWQRHSRFYEFGLSDLEITEQADKIILTVKYPENKKITGAYYDQKGTVLRNQYTREWLDNGTFKMVINRVNEDTGYQIKIHVDDVGHEKGYRYRCFYLIF